MEGKINIIALDKVLDKTTKKQLRKRASLLGCEYRYSGNSKKGFIHRIVRYKPTYESNPKIKPSFMSGIFGIKNF